jgi:fibronectin type 3 domain-containing protein
VAAYNAAGQSVYSVWTQGTTQGTAIAAPTALSATASSASSIVLAWQDNSANEAGFRIERAKDPNFTLGLAVFNVAADSATYTDSALAPNTVYYYRVFAVAVGGTISEASNTASATTLAAPPTAPSSLGIRTVGTTSISLSWQDNSSNEQGFYLERKVGTGTWTRIATLGQNVTTYSNVGLTRKTTYSYRLQAFNGSGLSAYSNTATARTR